MPEYFPALLQVGGFLFFIGLGFFFGRLAEAQHWSSLTKRLETMQDVTVTNLKTFPGATAGPRPPIMVTGEAVIASDYLKTFLSGLRRLFGGELKSFQTLMVRARQEALLRMMEKAKSGGYNAICNVRFTSSDIGGNTGYGGKGANMVVVVGTATAYYRGRAG